MGSEMCIRDRISTYNEHSHSIGFRSQSASDAVASALRASFTKAALETKKALGDNNPLTPDEMTDINNQVTAAIEGSFEGLSNALKKVKTAIDFQFAGMATLMEEFVGLFVRATFKTQDAMESKMVKDVGRDEYEVGENQQ